MSDDRTFVVTDENSEEVDRFMLTRFDEYEAAELASAIAKASGHTLDVHCDNPWRSPIYTVYPDGSIYRHATGRKRGWVKRS